MVNIQDRSCPGNFRDGTGLTTGNERIMVFSMRLEGPFVKRHLTLGAFRNKETMASRPGAPFEGKTAVLSGRWENHPGGNEGIHGTRPPPMDGHRLAIPSATLKPARHRVRLLRL